ncbi:hypothetical protein OG211_12550 [Streptomyces niveus]|uniref:hypothetical protein n=1 Tax=Streptomyces niveus TaxID=193462 RepID=UPI003864B2A3|nr:hypothetical protein OG211_12550 [Streptomyces niveus]
MSIEIRLVGGPADGRSITIPDAEPPGLYRIPMPPPLAEWLATPDVEPAPIATADYEPLLGNGWPRRADDGAYLYGHRAPKASPESRGAVENARREARAAEEKRAAELDAAWREIREQRPHFPADHRDLF